MFARWAVLINWSRPVNYFVNYFSNVSTHLFAQWAALVNWFGPILIFNLPSHVFQAFVRDGSKPNLLFLPCFGLSFLNNKVFIQQKRKKKKKKTIVNKTILGKFWHNFYEKYKKPSKQIFFFSFPIKKILKKILKLKLSGHPFTFPLIYLCKSQDSIIMTLKIICIAIFFFFIF